MEVLLLYNKEKRKYHKMFLDVTDKFAYVITNVMSLVTTLTSNKPAKTCCRAIEIANNRKLSCQRLFTFCHYPELWTTRTVGGTVEAALAHASLNVLASIMFLAQK